MDHRRWQSMSLEARYAHHMGEPQPVAKPAVAAPSLWSALRDVPLSDEARATFRRGEARKQLDAALAAEAEQAERERREFRDYVVHNTAIGQLLGGHDG